MNLKKDIPVLVFLILIMATAAAAAFILNVITGKMLEQSMIRAFAEPGRSAGGIARQIEGLDGVIRTETIEQDQAAAEFEPPWDILAGSRSAARLCGRIVEPGQAAAVLEHMEDLGNRVCRLSSGQDGTACGSCRELAPGSEPAAAVGCRRGCWIGLEGGCLLEAVPPRPSPACYGCDPVHSVDHVQAQRPVPTELRQAYREAENALAELQRIHSAGKRGRRPGGEIAAEEENHAGKLSEQKQVEAALIQSDDEIDRLQQRIARISRRTASSRGTLDMS